MKPPSEWDWSSDCTLLLEGRETRPEKNENLRSYNLDKCLSSRQRRTFWTSVDSSPLSSGLKHGQRNEASRKRQWGMSYDFRKNVMLSNCISLALAVHKGGLSSAGIHCLWRGLLRGSGNNWPDQVPTLRAPHLFCHNWKVTGFCQKSLSIFIWYKFDLHQLIRT